MTPRTRIGLLALGLGIIILSLGVPAWLRARAIGQEHQQVGEAGKAAAAAVQVQGEIKDADGRAAIHHAEQTNAEARVATHKRELAVMVAGLPRSLHSQLPPSSGGTARGAEAPALLPGPAAGAEDAGRARANQEAALEKAEEVIGDLSDQVLALQQENAAQAEGIAKRDELDRQRVRQIAALQTALDASHRASSGTWGAGVLYRPGQPQSYGAFVEKEFGSVVIIATGSRDGGTVGVGFKFGRH